jgi:hypothetical protein
MPMTLANTLLAKLNDWRPPERAPLTAAEGGWSATLTADRADVVGCLVWELAVRRTAPAPGGDLKAWAERVAGRPAGLVEPLKVLEVDALRNEALLRSDEPSQRGGDLFYFEVLLRGTSEALVRRYRAWHDPAKKREQVAFALTHEALAKLVDTLTAA